MGEGTIEVLHPLPKGARFRHGVLDFDGTVSLIREGWQQIMIPYFTQELADTPEGRTIPIEQLRREAEEFIAVNTGKQTIYQCIELAGHIRSLGGEPRVPQEYKDEYTRRLLSAIQERLDGLEKGTISPEELLVPGSEELLRMLTGHGVKLYLASGTDHDHVLKEAKLLGIHRWFGGRIYGAQRDYKTFSKKMVIDRIVKENHLEGPELLGLGDGYVEIENIRGAGGYACGVASNEKERRGIDQWKRKRLIRARADLIIPDYRNWKELENFLFPGEGQEGEYAV